MGKVTTAEAKYVRVERWFREKGYPSSSSSNIGNVLEDSQKASQVVQINAKPRQDRFLWWKWEVSLDYCLARLWIQKPSVGAQGKNWVLHVYGRENMDIFAKLATELAKEFQVDIHVRLESEKAKWLVGGW